MSRADRLRAAAIYWTADRPDRWRESGDELAELGRRAQRNGTTRREEAIRAWIAALTLISDAHPNPRTREAFNAARREVRADLLGLTRRQERQEHRAAPLSEELSEALPSPDGAPDAALLAAEEQEGVRALFHAVHSLAKTEPDRRHLLALYRAKATGEPVPAATRMKLRRWKRRHATKLAALRDRVAAARE